MTTSTSAPSADPPVVVVIGAGLVGASVGCALTAAGWQVHLRDSRISHARVAESLGAGSTDVPVRDEVGLVVAAVPPLALVEVITHALRSYPNAVVTDVGSVKASVLARLRSQQADLSRYVGSHPMAGSQYSGPMTAHPDLFEDRTWVITPHPQSDPAAVVLVEQMITACRARQVRMDVDEHDAAVARVSHLPHLMSAVLAGHLTALPTEQLELAGQGLRDVTRIAGGDPQLWQQILAANAAAIRPELLAIRDRLTAVLTALADDPEAVRAHLETGVQGTQRIPGKHGAAPVAYEHVVVEIPDAPGALGRLFTDVSDIGVNVEDVSIEHDQTREVGYLSLAVTTEQAEALRSVMAEAGWQVQP